MNEQILQIARDAKNASYAISKADTATKDRFLSLLAVRLTAERAFLKAENAKDIGDAERAGLSRPLIDRLRLTDAVIDQMIDGVRQVGVLDDPVGEVAEIRTRPNGLRVGRMRIPLGVIAIIYESRPNVTVDAAILCVKAGNAVILRGGKEAIHSNMALAKVISATLIEAGLPGTAVQVIPSTERELIKDLVSLDGQIDLVIPRGGEGLIRYVVENSKIPVLKHYKGVCHTFVDESADLEMAALICTNAKAQRPATCNSMETMLVHASIAQAYLPLAAKALGEAGVTLKGCSRTRAILPDIKEAEDADYSNEYLDLILNVKIVDDLDEAMEHIATYGSNHTETIVTSDYARAERFLREVSSGVVLVNASTRFSDGYQLGLGAEIGISTTKLHSFGPMGIKDLTTLKFIVYGNGQLRN